MIVESDQAKPLGGMRVLAALHGLELFGHERGNIEVFKALRELGATVRIAVSAREDGGEVARHLQELGFEIFPLPFRPQWSWQWLKKEGPGYGIRQLLSVWKCSRRFSKEIVSFRPTHFHLGSPLAYSFLSLALFWFRKIPLIWRMGDCPPVDSRFNYFIWKVGMRRTSRIVANTRFVAHTATEAGVDAGKISLIYNLAPTHSGKINDKTLPPHLSVVEQALIYAGSLSEHKGLMPLVEAFALVRARYPELRLWILGDSRWDGDFRRVLDERVDALGIRELIHFAGQVSDPLPWYAAASVHLAPSIWEEPGANVVMEAKRSGAPSVVFPSGGLPEMVRHQMDGYVCEEKTAACLAQAIYWMLEEPNRLNQMRDAALQDCEERFGRKRFLRQWADVYLKADI